MIDSLIQKIKETKAPICVGVDTDHSYVPNADTTDFKSVAKSILDFNKGIIDAICDIAPSVKVQAAYYEKYGYHGVKTFYKTIEYAKKCGLIVIADIKRNDIGSTAQAYSDGYLGKADLGGQMLSAFDADFITVNGYLGTDGIAPFAQDCKKYNKGMFILIKTSNPSSGEFQDLVFEGKALYEHMADKVQQWGSETIGKYGYSQIGGVVGATYAKQAQALREKYKNMFFLVPGYGAQGAGAQDIAVNFDKNGMGAIVNNSRGILLAYKKEKYAGMDYKSAARAATLDMREDLLGAFDSMGINI